MNLNDLKIIKFTVLDLITDYDIVLLKLIIKVLF